MEEDEAIPTSRVYTHRRCRQQTIVQGHDFYALSNPFAFTTGTMCMACGKAYSLNEFTWADTGEGIAARRRRLRAEASAAQKLFGRLIGPGLSALIGAVIARLIVPGDMPAVFAGAGVGFALFTWVLMPPLLGLLFQVDYRAID